MATTVKEQIPSFPELISFWNVMCEVAHGTTDSQRWAYHSTEEQLYAEELATAKVMKLIGEGKIRTTGRVSETKINRLTRWQIQQYKQHSKVRQYIEPDFWKAAVVVKSYLGFNTARIDGKEFTDILLVLDDCIEHVGEDVRAHAKDAQASNGKSQDTPEARYTTPYIDLMWKAIDHFNISEENQPIKETLVEWFLSQKISDQDISRATAEYMASFIRLPTSRLGGNRPWKVRAQQQPQH
jgi:hypothetical protein